MKKLLSVGLTALLALGLFAGCASNDDTVTTKAPEANPPAQSQENLVQEQATELIDAPVTDQVQAPVSEPESQNPTAAAPASSRSLRIGRASRPENRLPSGCIVKV